MNIIESFSSLEIQTVKASLDTKTDGELSDLLERDVEDVIALINSITDGQAEARSRDVANHITEKAAAKTKRAREKKEKVGKLINQNKDRWRQRNEELDAKQRKIANTAEYRRVRNEKDANRRKIPTRTVDYSRMHSIKVADKTWITIPNGSDAKAAIELYHANRLKVNNSLSKQRV